MSNFIISDTKQRNLKLKMDRLGIREKDITERFIRSSGPGGQNINKVSTCVYIKHIPTGVEVKCSRERSQAVNRFFARVMLSSKIEKQLEDDRAARKYLREKKRRQQRKRSKRSKEKMLEGKRKRSEKKVLRRSVGIE